MKTYTINVDANRCPIVTTAVLCAPVSALIGYLLAADCLVAPAALALVLVAGLWDLNREAKRNQL